MTLQPWSHTCSTGITLRGWYSAPSGKPLLHFVHGNGYCCRMYEPMLNLLAEDFDLWLCDAQGHGESDSGEHFLGWNRNAEMVAEAFEVGRARFGDVLRFASAHSFGGVLTSLIMAKHPRLFDEAVLLDPILFPPVQVRWMHLLELIGVANRYTLVQKTRKRRQVWGDRAEVYRALHGRGMFRGWDDAALNAYIEHALKDVDDGVQLKCSPEKIESEIFRTVPRHLWSSLRMVQTPVEVIYGDHSFPFVSRAVARWCAINRNIRAQVVPGGHCFMQEHPADTAQWVKAILLRDQA